MASLLSPEDQQVQSMPDASPTTWHRAHTTWFFEQFLLGPRGIQPWDAEFSFQYDDGRLDRILQAADFRRERTFTDDAGLFGLHLCRLTASN